MTAAPAHAGIELGRIISGEKHSPVVYFVWYAGDVKIGTTTNLLVRLGSMYARLDDVILLVPGGYAVENAYHQRFRRHQLTDRTRPGREFFSLNGVLEELGIEWSRPPVERLHRREFAPRPPGTRDTRPPVVLACRNGHSFSTRAKGGVTVCCPQCKADTGTRVSVWVPLGRPSCIAKISPELSSDLRER